jgi:hypothetical protein
MLATVRNPSWVCSASTHIATAQLQFRADQRNVDRRWCSGTCMQFRASDAVAGWWRVRAPLICRLTNRRPCSLTTVLPCVHPCRSNIANTARCWARETVIAMGDDLGTSSLPRGAATSDCYEYFAPGYNLDIEPALMKDMNTPGYLRSLKEKVCAELDSNVAVAEPASGTLSGSAGSMPDATSRKRSATAAGLPSPSV